MSSVVPPPNDRKRVKVYELRNNDWFDRGTGFCSGHVVSVSACIPEQEWDGSIWHLAGYAGREYTANG